MKIKIKEGKHSSGFRIGQKIRYDNDVVTILSMPGFPRFQKIAGEVDLPHILKDEYCLVDYPKMYQDIEDTVAQSIKERGRFVLIKEIHEIPIQKESQ